MNPAPPVTKMLRISIQNDAQIKKVQAKAEITLLR